MEKEGVVLNEVPQNTLPVMLDIFREIQATQFGDVNLTITTHRGIPVGLTVSSFRNEKFQSGNNGVAMERVMAVAKKMADDKETGTLSFTITFNEGEIKELTHQFYDKKSY